MKVDSDVIQNVTKPQSLMASAHFAGTVRLKTKTI